MSKATPPKVVTILINWNGKEDTLRCLESLTKSNYPTNHTVVVDNASSDDSLAVIKKQFPEITLLPQSKNLGFSGGNNKGMVWALEHDADYCFILNNDTTVEPNTITRLVETFQTNTHIGAVGPLIRYMEPKDTIAALGGTIRWNKAEAIQGYNQEPVTNAPKEPFETDFLTAAAVLVSKQAIEKAGMLPEGYFYGMEDAAWCVHIKRAGFTLVADPCTAIDHKESAATGQSSPIKAYYQSRNALLFLKKEWPEKWPYFLLTYHIKVIKTTVKWILQGKWSWLKGFWQGYSAFWRGHEGQRI
ncbi:MAG TPA: glycosyltransferase family 2 protein [Patescibacteria group bacterium]